MGCYLFVKELYCATRPEKATPQKQQQQKTTPPQKKKKKKMEWGGGVEEGVDFKVLQWILLFLRS